MKIKFLLAVMLLAAVNVFAQTPTFSSISGPILPNDIVTINGTNLIGVTKVVLKWNDPSNTNTLTITPYSVTSTAISFIVPDTSFFWYAHYNFYNSIDFVKIFVTKGSQSINTNFTSYLRHNGPVFTTIFSNAMGKILEVSIYGMTGIHLD